LERFGPRRGNGLARGFFEREPAAPAACKRRIVAPDLIDQILRLPHLAHVLFAQLRRVGRTGAAAALLPLAWLAGVARPPLAAAGLRIAWRLSAALAAASVLPVLTVRAGEVAAGARPAAPSFPPLRALAA